MGVGYFKTTTYDETINVKIVVACIKLDATSDISLVLSAILATNNENSLACPSRIPTSFDTDFFSPALDNKNLKHKGLNTSMSEASISAGITIWAASPKLNVAPTAKKNITKKKSRSGFKLSAIKSEMGLDASDTPATNAPISSDKPQCTASIDKAKHQPIESKNTYSCVRSNLAKSLTNT